jgi:hypothetical protein
MNVRIPHEYADLLDRILAPVPESATVYVDSESPELVHAAAVRHDNTVTRSRPHADRLSVLTPVLEFVERPPREVDHVLLCEPAGVETVNRTLDAVAGRPPVDCVVGNPYSFDRAVRRTLSERCSPFDVWRSLHARSYSVTVEGMHGPRSLFQSAVGRAWMAFGRLDRRDVRTHRMRAAYRERWLPFALTSCLVHLSGAGRP